MSLEGAEWCLELRSMDTLVNEGDKEVARRYDVRAGNTGRGTKWRGGWRRGANTGGLYRVQGPPSERALRLSGGVMGRWC